MNFQLIDLTINRLIIAALKWCASLTKLKFSLTDVDVDVFWFKIDFFFGSIFPLIVVAVALSCILFIHVTCCCMRFHVRHIDIKITMPCFFQKCTIWTLCTTPFFCRWTGTPNVQRWQASITPQSWWWFRIPLQTSRIPGTSLTTAFRM